MNITEFSSSVNERFAMMNRLLAEMYGLQIDWNADEVHLRAVHAHYMEKRFVLSEQYDTQYTKNVLIAEAINMYLFEIAPKRKKKKKSKV